MTRALIAVCQIDVSRRCSRSSTIPDPRRWCCSIEYRSGSNRDCAMRWCTRGCAKVRIEVPAHSRVCVGFRLEWDEICQWLVPSIVPCEEHHRLTDKRSWASQIQPNRHKPPRHKTGLCEFSFPVNDLPTCWCLLWWGWINDPQCRGEVSGQCWHWRPHSSTYLHRLLSMYEINIASH
jgi:hypothetical protein